MSFVISMNIDTFQESIERHRGNQELRDIGRQHKLLQIFRLIWDLHQKVEIYEVLEVLEFLRFIVRFLRFSFEIIRIFDLPLPSYTHVSQQLKKTLSQ